MFYQNCRCESKTSPYNLSFIQHVQTTNALELVLQNYMMVRMPDAKACFLSQSTENAPKPADLERLLVSVICCKLKAIEVGKSLLM